MRNNNQVFKISRELYGDCTATYNNVPFRIINKFDKGNISNFNWGDTSTGSEALSYAILEKVSSKEIANIYAKQYTKDVISKIKKDIWSLNATAVIQWINQNTNYVIDESAYFKDGTISYELKERRQEEERRKEERRIQREKDFQEEAQRRLKLYEAKQHEQFQEERRKEERRKEQRRKEERRQEIENGFQEKYQKSLKEIQAQYQEELNSYKKQIIKQNSEIEAYQAQLKKYKLFIESLDIQSMYDKYCNLD